MTDAWRHDPEYEDRVIEDVELHEDGASVTYDSGWSQLLPTDQHAPEEGMRVRCFGEGIGRPVRGVVDLDSETPFYYRTPGQQKEHMAITLYGADAEDWLERWDSGRGVWSIEMGGLGPGYEQAIQITAAEILRALLNGDYDSEAWSDTERWEADRQAIRDEVFEVPVVKELGLSGAQWGGALSLATSLYARGPREVLGDDGLEDRKIQVSSNFPSVTAGGA